MFLDRMECDHVLPALENAQRTRIVPVGEITEVAMNGVGGEDTDRPGGMMGAPSVEGMALLGCGRMGVIGPEDRRDRAIKIFLCVLSVSVRIEAVKNTGYHEEQ